MAQAHLFDAILLADIAEFEELAAAAEHRWLHRLEAGGDEPPPAALVRLRDRVAEAQRLLDALRDRFDQ